MTSPIADVVREVDLLKRKYLRHDSRKAEVRAVRHGDFDQVAPNLFSDEWPRPIVANKIDEFARHAAAALAPLPIISCQGGASDRSREIADKRTKIANFYLENADYQSQMQTGGDQFYTYGLIATEVILDFDQKVPVPIINDSIGIYPVWDRRGRTIKVAHVFKRHVIDLIADFPDLEMKIRAGVMPAHNINGDLPDTEVEVTKYASAKRIVMYISQPGEIVLVDIPNPAGKCPYVVTQKPGLDAEIRGTFDDLIWVQLALHAMQTYTLSAAAQAVEAPIAVPNDVQDVPIGPGAVIRTNDPRSVQRVNLEVPASAFAASSYLAEELRSGAITPEALGGSIDASVVTGKGVQQLMAGYSQQIANCQLTLVSHIRQVIELCFCMDEVYFGEDTKDISGRVESNQYKISYRPSRDIAGDYTVQVQYGGIAGLDPNRGLVFLLQALGGDLVSKDYVRRHLPSDINPDDEEDKIVAEKLRGALLETFAALSQSAPALIAQGQDPSALIAQIARVITRVEKGEPIEKVAAEIFPEQKPEPSVNPEVPPGAEQGGLPNATPEGFQANGLPQGLTPGMASAGPGARPTLQTLFAGLTSGGNPNLSGGVSRMLPAGGGV